MRFSEMVFRSLWAKMESMTCVYCSRVSGGTVKETKKAGQHEVWQIRYGAMEQAKLTRHHVQVYGPLP